ncbi:type IVB secretion system protein IcmH/DotU [Neptunicella marina]|uniref:Type VI secretion system protein TssL n=1 Tax=Neptunicella marina TaxID=2125989 RepID=A0A8J6M5R3_9ALTE|nr:type IVB secretion system protein IcmH/DotU [Neptunicella marina]MBC3766686.1 type VI secretion system protein TssL [Neptunicella marina]
MSNDDLDRTVIMPSPGRRRSTETSQPAQAPSPDQQVTPQSAPASLSGQMDNTSHTIQTAGVASHNPLINAATVIFSLARQLRNTPQHQDVGGLHKHICGLMQQFEKNVINQGIAPDVAYEARYILCAYLDEIVLNTPWGHHSIWSHSGLLSTLHNDTTGGERFFQILARKSDAPAQNVPILELMYHCLSLGFQGKFAVQDNGRAALDQITQGVYHTLKPFQQEPGSELSEHWQPAADGRPTVAKLFPWWVVVAVIGGLLTLIYVAFFFALNDDSDAVFNDIGKLGREVPQMIQSRQTLDQPLVDPGLSSINLDSLFKTLNGTMANAISNGQLSIVQQAYGIKITVHNNGLFPSGSADMAASYRPLFDRLADVLTELPGPIVVSGHTDSQKIRTLRFPSNWHLSDERAKAIVRELVAAGVDNSKLVAQGKADTEPVASNETAQGRQQNRRIELFIRSY